MKLTNKDKMTLELYADKAVIRLSDGDTDVELHLEPKIAAAMGLRLNRWATEDRSHLDPAPTPKEPGHE